MAARKRRDNESFEKYRKNLKKEQIEMDKRLSGKMRFSAIEFFFKFIKGLGKKMHKRTRTYDRKGQRQLIKSQRLSQSQANTAKGKLRRVQARG